MSEPPPEYEPGTPTIDSVRIGHFRRAHEPRGVRIFSDTVSWLKKMDDVEVHPPGEPRKHSSGDGDEDVDVLTVTIHTTEGTRTAEEGNWVFEDADGRHYPITHEQVKERYELLGPNS